MDNHVPLVPGMKLFISNEIKGRYTKDTQGWDPGMDKYIGTIQTIEDATRSSVMFKDLDFHWDPRDLISISCTDEIELIGKKQKFDVTELT